ncbi:MAG: HEAT repeat domain-containing protein [Bacteroidota bacterium]
MGFYDLSKEERAQKVSDIQLELLKGVRKKELHSFIEYFSDDDTYIRKAAYQGFGRIYSTEVSLRKELLRILFNLRQHPNELIRQTVVNAAGEIGMFQFEAVQAYFDEALFDEHHKVRNAVIGSMKKMSQKNPIPTLAWAKQYLAHPDKEVRREICHGIELRGRTHPQDILPLLQKLEHDKTKRVRDTLVHVIGQISYKKGCLPTVVSALNQWANVELVRDAADEIVDVHSEKRYAKFSALTQEEVVTYLSENLKH